MKHDFPRCDKSGCANGHAKVAMGTVAMGTVAMGTIAMGTIATGASGTAGGVAAPKCDSGA